jgi:ribosome recycling factor
MSEQVSDQVFTDCERRMSGAIEALKREFAKLRVGKASPALLEGVMVDAYGTQTPLNQLGTIGAPEARLLVVQPWDKSVIGAIEKAIRASDLGLNPSSDGQVVRVPIPALTEERRKELVKVARGFAEESRVSVRNARRDANEQIKKMKKAGEIAEDDEKRAHERVQELTDRFIGEIDDLLAAKEAEILEI